MTNPLDELPFDVNSLRVNNEFNWDCIEGIDQIHKDILKSYEKIVLSLVTPIAKTDAAVQSIGDNIVNYASAMRPKVETAIDTIDNSITNQLNSSVAPLVNQYGTPNSPEAYYLLYRQMSCNSWKPVIEKWAVPPSDRPHYGPYKSSCALVATCCGGNGVGSEYPTLPPYSPVLQGNLDHGYGVAVQLGWDKDDQCPPEFNCGISIYEAKAAIEATCGPIEGGGTPIVPPVPQVWTYANALTCVDFLASTWTKVDTYGKNIHDNYGQLLADLYYVNENGGYLSEADYYKLVINCRVTPPPPDYPPYVPPEPPPPYVPPEPPPEITECSPELGNCPTPPPPYVPPIIGTTGGGISSECCESITASLDAIAKALTGKPIPITSVTAEGDDCSSMSDDEYAMSDCLEKDINDYLNRVTAEYSPATPNVPIRQRMVIQLLEMSAPQPPFDTNTR